MRHPWLTVRMAVAGAVVFGIYALFAVVAHGMGLGLPVVLAASVAFVAFQYKLGTWLALRSADAEELPADRHPRIHEAVERLSAELGIEAPRLMLGVMGGPNAFAVGRRGAGTVVLSRSLVDLLEPDELEGVLAHELAHLRNRDVTMMLLGQSVASIVSMATFWIVALSDDHIGAVIAGWVLSTVVNAVVMVASLAISRYREYVADGDAVDATGEPRALGRALVKIANASRGGGAADLDDSVAALCIFGGGRGLLATLFATHPPIEERVERLAPELVE